MPYNNQLGLREKEGEITKKVHGSLENTSGRTTIFIYKVCGARFEDSHVLDSHMPEAHYPKETITINDIVDEYLMVPSVVIK